MVFPVKPKANAWVYVFVSALFFEEGGKLSFFCEIFVDVAKIKRQITVS